MTTTNSKVKRTLDEYEHQDIVRELEFIERTLWDLLAIEEAKETNCSSFIEMIRDRFNNVSDDINHRLKVYDDLEKSK